MGFAQGPMGQPAMYEYRFADDSSTEFGKIDKPSFLWAGGFYLYSLYRILGMTDNEWNISVTRHRPTSVDSVSFSLGFGKKRSVAGSRKDNRLGRFSAGKQIVPSLVLPIKIADAGLYRFDMGKLQDPYLESVNAILQSIWFNENRRILQFSLLPFQGHPVAARIVAPRKPQKVTLDGEPVNVAEEEWSKDGAVTVTIRFSGSDKIQHVTTEF